MHLTSQYIFIQEVIKWGFMTRFLIHVQFLKQQSIVYTLKELISGWYSKQCLTKAVIRLNRNWYSVTFKNLLQPGCSTCFFLFLAFEVRKAEGKQCFSAKSQNQRKIFKGALIISLETVSVKDLFSVSFSSLYREGNDNF